MGAKGTAYPALGEGIAPVSAGEFRCCAPAREDFFCLSNQRFPAVQVVSPLRLAHKIPGLQHFVGNYARRSLSAKGDLSRGSIVGLRLAKSSQNGVPWPRTWVR